MTPADFATLVSGLLTERGMSRRALAGEIPINAGQLSRILNGERTASAKVASRCDEILDTGCRLAEAAQRDRATRKLSRRTRQAVDGSHPGGPAGTGTPPHRADPPTPPSGNRTDAGLLQQALQRRSAALLLQHQPEAAALTATQGFALAVETDSLRSIHRLHAIERDLTRWQALPEVQNLTDLLTSHRYR